MKNYVLIIDPQNDFCLPSGSLYVDGATEDMSILTGFIIDNSDKIDDIFVTLDTHNPLDIAHSSMWINAEGKNPDPFTIITNEDVVSGKWRTRNALMFKPPGESTAIPWAEYYTRKLEENNKYSLCIWPEHCLIGSVGSTIFPLLLDALNDWARDRFATVNYVAKGINYLTESYSALKAEVEDPFDPATRLNTEIIAALEDPEVDNVIIAGEALSHCVANTVRDIVNNLVDTTKIKKFILLEDCCSSVTGFEELGTQFIEEMKERGMRVQKSTDTILGE